MVERPWSCIGIGIPVFYVQDMAIGQDTQPICISASLSVKINILFIEML